VEYPIFISIKNTTVTKSKKLSIKTQKVLVIKKRM